LVRTVSSCRLPPVGSEVVRPLGATEIAQENWQRRELLRNCHCAHDSSEEPNPEEPISDRLCVLITVLGAPLLAQNSGLANAVDTTVNLFRVHYAGADSHVHEFYVAGNGWHDFDLTMAARRPTVAAGSPLANAVDTTVDLFRVHYVEPTPTCTSSMWTMADGRTSILRRRRAAPQSRPALRSPMRWTRRQTYSEFTMWVWTRTSMSSM